MAPQIAVVHSSAIPSATFDDFVRIVSVPKLELVVEEREPAGVYAGVGWLIPTAVIVYLAKSYFDSFLKEMGKDHYHALKDGLKNLRARLFGPNAPNVTIISTTGKANTSRQYSLVLSILAEADSGRRFKLLLEREVEEPDFERAIDAFLLFVEAYHNQTLEIEAAQELKSARVLGGTILVAFDHSANAIKPKDPIGK